MPLYQHQDLIPRSWGWDQWLYTNTKTTSPGLEAETNASIPTPRPHPHVLRLRPMPLYQHQDHIPMSWGWDQCLYTEVSKPPTRVWHLILRSTPISQTGLEVSSVDQLTAVSQWGEMISLPWSRATRNSLLVSFWRPWMYTTCTDTPSVMYRTMSFSIQSHTNIWLFVMAEDTRSWAQNIYTYSW